MPHEIEAKVLEIDEDAVREKLESADVERVFDGEVRSLFFDFDDGRIEENGLLRLRQMGEKAFITLKQEVSKEDAKVMEETEFTVSSFAVAREFLLQIGLEELHDSRKERAKWEQGDVEYIIDRYPGIPPLLEIEAPDMAILEAAFEQLGFSMDETVSWGAEELLEHYGKEDW